MKFTAVIGRFCAAIASTVAVMTANPAQASMYFEVGDAGITAETAQYISWETSSIFGSLHADDGADVYAFDWAGGYFMANTDGSSFDTMLSLFDESGAMLLFNDDLGGGISYSQISVELDPGSYFLGITYYPNNYMGAMRYYLDSGIEGTYQIQKSISMPLPQERRLEEEIASIPEPASLALVALGFLGILFSRRQNRGPGESRPCHNG